MEIREELRKCDICGCEEYTEIWKKPPWTKTCVIKFKNKLYHVTDVMCNNCGVLYKNPMMSKESMCIFYEEAYLKLYEPINVSSISGVSIAQRVITTVYTLDWLDSIGYDLAEKKVFEIGCGFGTLLAGMESLGAKIAGIEPGKRSCEIGEKVFGFQSINDTFENMDITEQYDLVIINNTLEHFHSPTKVLKKAKTMLSPHGKILIEVPSAWYPYPGIPVDGFLSSAHSFTFTQSSFEYLVDRCGMMVERMGYKGHKKCMFFLLSTKKKTDEQTYVFYTPQPIQGSFIKTALQSDHSIKLIERYHNVDAFMDAISDQVKFTKKIKEKGFLEISKEHPDQTNILKISYVNWLLNQGKAKESLDFLRSPGNTWKNDQSEDLDMNFGTLTYLEGLTYRHLGDFLQAKKCFKKAMLQYPRIDKYNFVSDMMINGLIPENIWSTSSWYNCKKTLDMM